MKGTLLDDDEVPERFMFEEACKKKSLGDFEGAHKLFLQITTNMKPVSAQSLNCHGLCFYYLGDNEKAEECINKAIKMKPNNFILLNNQACLYNQHKRIEGYNKSLFISQNAITLNNRGLAFFHKHKFTEAHKDFDEALKLNPQSAAILNNRGLLYFSFGRYKHAIEDFEKSYTIKNNYFTLGLIAEAEMELNNFGKALDWLSYAFGSKNFSIYNAGYFFGLRAVLNSAIDRKLGEKVNGDLKQAKRVMSASYYLHYFYGRVSINVSDFAKSIEYFSDCLKEAGDCPENMNIRAQALAWRSWGYWKESMLKESLADIESALSIFPEHVEWTNWKSSIQEST